jgi:hypothetical protein
MQQQQPDSTCEWSRAATDSTWHCAADSLKTASFGLNSAGLSQTMNAGAATLFWSQFSRPSTLLFTVSEVDLF